MLGEKAENSFINPVFERSFPDPFILKFAGEYFAYCTGLWDDGRVFGVLRSVDLINWTELGGAMSRLASDAPFYWAPEVTYSNGKFYLYYSVGNETLMEIRVAVSERPDGGFEDSGHILTTEDFAIDPHVFSDDDGRRFLFYATDFLEHEYIGTGTVFDEMLDPYKLRGQPKPVTRAQFDWQIYDPNRREKGGVRWHTVEGPFVLKRKGVYYEMFSGGNWQKPTYGVSFAVSDRINAEGEWEQFADGKKLFPILRTIPDMVIGPGHNSVVRGPNNRELYCVYHQWHCGERKLSIDRMDFAGGKRLYVAGAGNRCRTAPRFSQICLNSIGVSNITSGGWDFSDGKITSSIGSACEIVLADKEESFLLETSFRSAPESSGNTGLRFTSESGDRFYLNLDGAANTAEFGKYDDGRKTAVRLTDDFNRFAVHLLRVERTHREVRFWLDDRELFKETEIAAGRLTILFFSESGGAEISAFELTRGYEELFENDKLARRGWIETGEKAEFGVENGILKLGDRSGSSAKLEKLEYFDDQEIAVNIAISESFSGDFDFAFEFTADSGEIAAEFVFGFDGSFWNLTANSDGKSKTFKISDLIETNFFRQFIFKRTAAVWKLTCEGMPIGEIEAAGNAMRMTIKARNCTVGFDMVRVTAI